MTTAFAPTNGSYSLSAGPASYQRPSATPIPEPRQIIAAVEAHERYTDALRTRMEADWALKTLVEFDAGDGYQSYTSNDPLTYFNKMSSGLSSGRINIQIPVGDKRKNERERQDAKERFLIGILAANDERLVSLGQPSLLDQLAGYIPLRGWFCGRAMLAKDIETGETYPNITPWDPIHVSWGMGAKGLRWVCEHRRKLVSEVREEYPGWRADRDRADYLDESFSEEEVEVFDWYDATYNMVVIDNVFAKPPTPHGSPRVPCFFGAVGGLPLIQSHSQSGQNNLVHYGESIYESNRGIYQKVNLIYSTMLQLIALSRDQAFTITSQDGTKTLKKNPFLEGAQTPLSAAAMERIDLLPLLQMSHDTGAFLGLVAQEVQRGAIPYPSYGQLAFQLSGYAVNLLSQAQDAPVIPRKKAIESAYKQICGLIGDQFVTGAFDVMQLSGRGNNRDWFDEQFGPEMLRGVGVPEITLVTDSTQDELQKVQLAVQLRQPINGMPTAADRWIWDNVLKVQDADEMARQIKEQMGERMLPAAALFTIGQALWQSADPGPEGEENRTLSMIYMRAAGFHDMQATLGPGQGQPGEGGGGPGFSPDVLPGPAQGQPPEAVQPQQGRNVPVRNPRPVARRPSAEGPVIPPFMGG